MIGALVASWKHRSDSQLVVFSPCHIGKAGQSVTRQATSRSIT